MTDKKTMHARLAATLMALLLAVTTQAKKQDVFLFGVAASFNDSTVYITDIQEVKQAYIEDTRQKFLVGRNGYSDQLRNHFSQQGQPHRTCTTFWATSRKDLEKKYVKVMQKYGITTDAKKAAKKKKKDRTRYRVVTLDQTTFAYRVVEPDEGVTYVDPKQAEEAARASKRQEAKAKNGKPDGHMPPPDGQTPPDGQRPPMDR